MMNWIERKNLKRAMTGLVAMSAPLFVACVKGGSISSSGSSTASGALTVSLVYPTGSGPTWTPITSGSVYYIKGLELTITGVCTRGVASIKVDEGSGNYAETATCNNEGSFTFNKIYTSGQQGDKTLTLTAYDVGDTAITGATASVQVRIDATAPTAPVVTTPASSPHTDTGASSTFAISGTCSADTVKITGPGGVEIIPSGTTWTYNATLVVNSLGTDYTFNAWDLAGNQSGDTTQRIIWSPSISVLASGPHPGGPATHGGSGLSLESAVFAVSGTSPDSNGSGLSLETGINFITNTVRAD